MLFQSSNLIPFLLFRSADFAIVMRGIQDSGVNVRRWHQARIWTRDVWLIRLLISKEMKRASKKVIFVIITL